VLLLVVVAGVSGVFLVTDLREPPARAPRAARTPATERAAAPTPVAAEPPARRLEAAKAAGKRVEKAAPPAGKQGVETVAVPTPELTPRRKKEQARRRAAHAAVIGKSRSKQERQQLERHLRRFVGGGGAKPGAGAWVDPQLEALQAGAAVTAKPLPVPEPDESERRRIEQLEKLRQRKAVGLLDHIHGGLAWLALHQSPNGPLLDRESLKRCKELGHDPPCLSGGRNQHAIAGTAFAVMALLDFRDQDVRGLFEPSLAAAVQWLRRQQRPDGAFPGRQVYESAIALMALAQAAESTGEGKLREAVRKGLELFAQRPGPLGGYRYGFGAPGDLSATGWVAQAVEMARRAGVEIPPSLEPGLSQFLDSVWQGEHRFSYLSRSVDRPSLYPVGILMARILWPDPHPGLVVSWRQWLTKGVGQGRPRLYTLYYGVRVAIAFEQRLPDPWRKWVFELAKTQTRKGTAAGAFLRGRGWLIKSGRTLHTAVAVLTLEHSLYLR
jgi:hypothetical protein